MSSIFRAKYGGRCAAECGEAIEVGDEVKYVDDQVVHLSCEVAFNLSDDQKSEICQQCWTAHAPNQKECW